MKILVQDKQGVRALEPGFADEKELQTFLRENSDLMPTDEIEVGTPPLLCIGWEVGVASGSQDLLYIDETGLLTIVETKLKKNPEARREVVGQILEYASDASAWTASDVEAKAQKFYASKECPPGYERKSLEEALRYFLEKTDSPAREDFSYEDFLNQISTNLQRGHIRLIIAIDETPPSLLRTVEFVNRFSERFEMYLIQLKRFHDEATGQNIFVPALFGRVGSTRRPPGRLWDKEGFLQQASNKARESMPVLERLLEFAEREKGIVWGKGATFGSFAFTFTNESGKRVPAFLVMANGMVSIDFSILRKSLDAKVISSFRDDLALAEDVPREVIATDTWKAFDVAALSSRKSWKAFQRAVLALKTSQT